MPIYDFKSLSPYDFEILCRDLLQCELGVRLQSFKTGRDKGIDFRYSSYSNNTIVVQCKHYANSSLSTLLSHLQNDELPKVKLLSPSRYIFVASLGLTPSNQESIANLFSPYCQSPQDIYGRDDLNNLLSKYPKVERDHFKLWLTSTPVLQRVLHNASYVQTTLDRNEIEARLKVYVEIPAVAHAQKILEKTHACIISGIPGIGKTTLAHMLLIEYIMGDWEVVTVRQNIQEALDRFSSDRAMKQIFWYDDFLGQVSLGDKLAKNEDRALTQLLSAVSKHSHRRFILTTREYILHQAEQAFEILARTNMDYHKHMLLLTDYSTFHKAKILANHLYFCDVPQSHVNAILDNHRYMEIINHRNYSPRIIQWLTDTTRTTNCSPEEYPDIFIRMLDNPVRLWEHAFLNQLSEAGRHLMLTLAACGQVVTIDDLRRAFDEFYLFRSQKYNFSTTPTDFAKAMKELDGTFVAVQKFPSATTVEFHNPSIMDYVVHYLTENTADVSDLVETSVFFEQIKRMCILLKDAPRCAEIGKVLRAHGSLLWGALKRTLHAPGCRLNHRHGGLDVTGTCTSVVMRLRESINLATQADSADAKDLVLEEIGKFAEKVDVYHPGRDDLLNLVEKARCADWIDKDKIRTWLNRTKSYLLHSADSWNEVQALASWRAKHPEDLSDNENETLAKKICEEIENATSYYLYEETDADIIRGFVEELESIAKVSGLDYRLDIGSLEERAEELEPEEPDYDKEEWHSSGGSLASGSVNEIDSLFDSLR